MVVKASYAAKVESSLPIKICLREMSMKEFEFRKASLRSIMEKLKL